jgi:hypothetical protein
MATPVATQNACKASPAALDAVARAIEKMAMPAADQKVGKVLEEV